MCICVSDREKREQIIFLTIISLHDYDFGIRSDPISARSYDYTYIPSDNYIRLDMMGVQ